MGPFSYHDGRIVCGQGTVGRVHVLWYFDIRPHRVRTACPNSAVSPLSVCCGHWTLLNRSCGHWTLHVPTVQVSPNRSGCSRHCTLEKRPYWRRGPRYFDFCTAPPHITDLLSATLDSSMPWRLVSSAMAALCPACWDFHFCATLRNRSRAEPPVSKGSISFTNLW